MAAIAMGVEPPAPPLAEPFWSAVCRLLAEPTAPRAAADPMATALSTWARHVHVELPASERRSAKTGFSTSSDATGLACRLSPLT
jgi:hypothetical protein